jgi:hypothetical protein
MQSAVLTTQSIKEQNYKVIFTNPKVNKNKQLTAAILNENTKSALYIETDYLIAPFGLSSFEKTKGVVDPTSCSWSIALKAHGGSIGNMESITTLFEFLKTEIDEKAIDYGIQHSMTIFKKNYTADNREMIKDAFYSACVKAGTLSEDGTPYPDKIMPKVMRTEKGGPDLLVFKDSSEPINISSWEELQEIIPKGSPVRAIIQPRLYFINNKYGVNFKVLQIKLPNIQKVGRPITYAFSEPTAPAADTSEVKPPAPPVSKPKASETEAEDSEEEVEEEEVEEEEEEA